MNCSQVVVLILMVWTEFTSAALWTLEAEDSKGQHIRNYRSKASGYQSVLLYQGSSILLSICFIQTTNLTVKDVVFSNDGHSDNVSVGMDNFAIGSFRTRRHDTGGQSWNIFYHSGELGSTIVTGGMHRLSIYANDTDRWGLEIDKIVIEIADDHLNSDILHCRLPCSQDTPVLKNPQQESVSEGYITQKSYPTACAEEDNVHIPVFHESVSEYTISATLPMYHSFRNDAYQDFENCSFAQAVFWNYTSVNLKSILNRTDPNTLSVLGSHVNSHGIATIHLGLLFYLDTPKEGVFNSEMGGVISLSLSGIMDVATVTVLCRGKFNRYTTLQTYQFTNASHTFEWQVPDFILGANANHVILVIVTSHPETISINHFYFQRRDFEGDRMFEIYKEDIIIEGLHVDFWWQQNTTMEVTLSTTSQSWTAHYIRFYVPVPWSNNGWCQIMVLYQDGNVRLLPMTPPGASWIPFGSSVLIGQTDKTMRPSAPISKVTIDPRYLTLDVVYADGGTASMTLLPLVERTELRVTNINMARDTTTNPFATFRSMYVEGGNADSDSVASDTQSAVHVMENWGNITGTVFGIFRRCQSTHLTQSPDLNLRIVKT
ncbi:uncharacterized protein LOC124112954 [Haliotis rufescens]|uniref:uncharacterized protein LOC124112954 n=1 Tax=Haliotis rufescens TaxID=6454 RepID=UPI00201F332A|nr:uncharacterized protein LOC124112954 [Haliotis rufescens]XP_046329124.2 uncharacterized protein LOC124112954 [Haliotis rufescens]